MKQQKSPNDLKSKVMGESRYIQDINLPGQLIGGTFRSPHPHARITRLDVSKARQVPGVVAVLTGEDVPHHEFGPTKFKDWNILAKDRVLFVGDEIAVVAAENKEALDTALALIEVEFEQLPAVFDPEDSLLPDAPVIHEGVDKNRSMHVQIERGDIVAAKKAAHIVRGGRYHSNRIYQGHMEPIGVLASWSEEDGLTLWAASHIPYRARETYAAGLDLPEERVRIIVPPIGGSFGSKYVLKLHLSAAVLTMATGRPVKMVLDRLEDMITAHPRVPLTFDIEIGADEHGKFLYKTLVVYGDAGARTYWSPNVMSTACSRPDCVYNFGNIKAEGHLCYTNNSPTTCMRGFGNAETLFAVESVIDELAIGLGMDPAAIRLLNIVQKGETTIHGYKLETCSLDECIEKVKELSGWDRRNQLPPYRGLGMGLANHVSGFRAIDPRFEGSTAIIRLNLQGELEVETGEIELGQGMSVTYARIASLILGVPAEEIRIKSGDTAKYPFGIGTLASRSTVMGGNAVQQAAKEMLKRINELVQQVKGASAEFKDGVCHVEGKAFSLKEIAFWHRTRNAGDDFSVKAVYVPNTEMPDASYYGNPSPNYPFAAHVAEVEVDPETGRSKIIGYWAVHDSGTIIHQTMAKSQVIGAVAQGIGWVLMEDFKVIDGRVQNPSLMDYRMPGAKDIPSINIAFIEDPDPNGPMGAKSIGEVALDPVPGAIANAIAHATGKRGYQLPLSPERVWKMINE